MHPLDITESDRWGDPLYGMEPELSLGGHARLALRRALEWFRDAAAGKIIRTRTGDRRVMPYSLRLLARQYVHDHLVRDAFETEAAWQFARHYYVFALEVELGNHIEPWAFEYSDEWPAEYQDLVKELGLEEE